MKTQRERFDAKIDRSGGASACHVWCGATVRFGYGQVQFDGRLQSTHRVAWQLANGAIPAGMCVLHACDNPPCCNPAHLSVGTHAENMADRDRKGRQPRGSQHYARIRPNLVARGERRWNAKLSVPVIRSIRGMYLAGVGTQEKLGTYFGITRANVGLIVRGEAWTHVA